ncbi:MAG: ATP-binding protein, partial [Sedimentibacter sp.]
GRNIGYDALNYEGKNIYFNYLNDKLRDRLGISVLNDDILKTLGLMNGDNYTIAAALLSDKNPIDHAGISLIRFADKGLNIRDKKILRNISILKQFDNAVEFYHKHINTGELINGVYRETIEEIPLVAYREAIANAIVHREYMLESDIRVEIFDDRAEIISPGGLPIGITEAEYLDGRVSIPRNKIIADIFLRLGIIERLATGIRRIREYYKNSGVNPEFLIAQNSIKVVLPKINHKTESSEQFNIFENQLNENELKIMKYVKSTGRIIRKEAEGILSLKKTQTVQILGGMVDKGVLLKIGAGRNTNYVANV